MAWPRCMLRREKESSSKSCPSSDLTSSKSAGANTPCGAAHSPLLQGWCEYVKLMLFCLCGQSLAHHCAAKLTVL